MKTTMATALVKMINQSTGPPAFNISGNVGIPLYTIAMTRFKGEKRALAATAGSSADFQVCCIARLPACVPHNGPATSDVARDLPTARRFEIGDTAGVETRFENLRCDN